jgi:hypothetical protein
MSEEVTTMARLIRSMRAALNMRKVHGGGVHWEIYHHI